MYLCQMLDISWSQARIEQSYENFLMAQSLKFANFDLSYETDIKREKMMEILINKQMS